MDNTVVTEPKAETKDNDDDANDVFAMPIVSLPCEPASQNTDQRTTDRKAEDSVGENIGILILKNEEEKHITSSDVLTLDSESLCDTQQQKTSNKRRRKAVKPSRRLQSGSTGLGHTSAQNEYSGLTFQALNSSTSDFDNELAPCGDYLSSDSTTVNNDVDFSADQERSFDIGQQGACQGGVNVGDKVSDQEGDASFDMFNNWSDDPLEDMPVILDPPSQLFEPALPAHKHLLHNKALLSIMKPEAASMIPCANSGITPVNIIKVEIIGDEEPAPDSDSELERPYKCPQCASRFKRCNALNEHMSVHTGLKPFTCKVCDNAFAKRCNLSAHMRTHSDARPFNCDKCESSYKNKASLTVHQRSHTGERPFHCDLCDLKFVALDNLKRHRRKHTGERPFICKVCHGTFAQSCNLRSHMKVHNPDIKPYECEICGMAYSRKNSLLIHRGTHTGIKPHKCTLCDASFAQKAHVDLHMRKHTGEKPYKCELCETAFGYKNALVAHLRTHTGERPYKCQECGASFAQGGNLQAHMRKHTGEKPFKCLLCDAAFAQKRSLVLHARCHSDQDHTIATQDDAIVNGCGECKVEETSVLSPGSNMDQNGLLNDDVNLDDMVIVIAPTLN